MIDFGGNNNNNLGNQDNKSFMGIFGSSANKKTHDKPTGFLQTLQQNKNKNDSMKPSAFLSFMGNANDCDDSNDYDETNENTKEKMDICTGSASGSPSFFLGMDQSVINPLSSSSVNTPDAPLNKSKVLDCPLSFGSNVSNPLSNDINNIKPKTTSKINQIEQIQQETPIQTINKNTEEKEESFKDEKKEKLKKMKEELFKGSPSLSMISMLTPIKPIKHESKNKINESLNNSLFLINTSPMKCKTQQRERSKSIDSLDAQFSSIKLNKTKKKTKTEIVATPVLIEEPEEKEQPQKKEEKQQQQEQEQETKQEPKQEPKQEKEEEEEEDELLSDVDIMTDDEFFGTTTDHSTQTRPVVIFQEEDIPKIRYNGKLLSDIAAKANNSSLSNISYNHSMSQSWIFDDDNDTNNNKQNESCNNSAKSDKILYRHPNNIHFNNNSCREYSRPLRYDSDSIQLITPMDNLTTSESESDTEHITTTKKNIMPSFNRSDFCLNLDRSDINIQQQQQRIIPRLYPRYRLKRKDKNSSNRLRVPGQQTIGFVLRPKKNRNNTLQSQQMFKQYKISKLAQNPNYTVCNAHNKTGDLV